MMESIYDRTVQLGEYVPEPDDDKSEEQFTMECLPSQRSEDISAVEWGFARDRPAPSW